MTDTKYISILHAVQAAIAALREIEQLPLDSNAQLDAAEKQADNLTYTTAEFIETVIPRGIEHEISRLLSLNLKDDYFYLRNPFEQHKALFIKEFPMRIRNCEALLELLEQADPFRDNRSYAGERTGISVQIKKELLLVKLYSLRKYNIKWPARLIFTVNEVELDNDQEVAELINALRKSGYVDCNEYTHNGWSQITVKGKDLVEKKLLPKRMQKNTFPLKSSSEPSLDIFISHSSADVEIVKTLIDLLRSALPIPAAKIRCTSVDGYRLPAGASTDQVLRNEVNNCKVLIGAISPKSMTSAYVLFELGARWGQEKPMLPVVIGTEGKTFLRGPLSGINALDLSQTAQVHQLVGDIAGLLKIKQEKPAVYTAHLDRLVTTAIES
ncbi:MAG TPA: toll/interleukin-1 receptor domain-containing protein [Mucilaginibacter sp.]|nr:toll/interleukin-1 receptor domain-containing protein [Mucilaginibacter sp.]